MEKLLPQNCLKSSSDLRMILKPGCTHIRMTYYTVHHFSLWWWPCLHINWWHHYTVHNFNTDDGMEYTSTDDIITRPIILTLMIWHGVHINWWHHNMIPHFNWRWWHWVHINGWHTTQFIILTLMMIAWITRKVMTYYTVLHV